MFTIIMAEIIGVKPEVQVSHSKNNQSQKEKGNESQQATKNSQT